MWCLRPLCYSFPSLEPKLLFFLKKAPCFIHCEGKAVKGGGVFMSIMIPSCNGHADMKFSKKNFAQHAKNAIVKNIITIDKYNVGMKVLIEQLLLVTLSRQKRLQLLFLGFRFRFRFRIPDSGFRIPAFPYARRRRRIRATIGNNVSFTNKRKTSFQH